MAVFIHFILAQTGWRPAAFEAEGEGIWRDYGSLAGWHRLIGVRKGRIKGQAEKLLKKSLDRGYFKICRSVGPQLHDTDNFNLTRGSANLVSVWLLNCSVAVLHLTQARQILEINFDLL